MINIGELLDALDDPRVQEKVKGLLTSQSKILPIEHQKIDRMCSWWYNNGGTEPTLTHFNKLNLLNLIKGVGVKEVKCGLQKALDSPINIETNFMYKHLNDLGWCTKPENFKKITNGNYDNSSKVVAMVDTDESALSGLE